jgi:hypothetical protein
VIDVDDPADVRPHNVLPLVNGAPAPYVVAGNRFGSYGFGAGLTGLLLALAPVGHAVAWILVLAALPLGLRGFTRYVQGSATNRDTSLVGLAMAWVGLIILMVEASVAVDLPPEAYSYVL